MRDKDQKIRFTDSDMNLIKALFGDDAEIVYVIRKVLLQFELSTVEKMSLEKMINDKTKVLLTRFFLPYLESDAPLFQMTNLILGLGSDTKSLDPISAWPHIQAKKLEIEYLEQQLKVLFGGTDKPKILLADLGGLSGYSEEKHAEGAWVNVTAWNFILSYIDSNLAQMKVLAGLKSETVEQTKLRLGRDSTK